MLYISYPETKLRSLSPNLTCPPLLTQESTTVGVDSSWSWVEHIDFNILVEK